MHAPRLSIVIPALNAADALPRTLASLDGARAKGLVAEIIVVDGGSRDGTPAIARAARCTLIETPPGRGAQLAAGAAAAHEAFLLFLHADTVLEDGWAEAVAAFMSPPGEHARAAAFRFRFDASGLAPAVVAFGVRLRCALFKLPYGDQGLLISRDFYHELGGFMPMPLMEDVDIVRRIGRARMKILRPAAITSAARYEKTGYLRRVLRNWRCLRLYRRGVAPEEIARIYE